MLDFRRCERVNVTGVGGFGRVAHSGKQILFHTPFALSTPLTVSKERKQGDGTKETEPPSFTEEENNQMNSFRLRK